MPNFPKPRFIDDPNSVQCIAFKVIEQKLKKNFFALSPDAYTDLLHQVSGLCETFYNLQKTYEEDLIMDIGEERFQEIKAESRRQVFGSIEN